MAIEKKTLESLLKNEDIKERFQSMLGRKSAGFMSSIMSAVKSNPALSKCDPMTVISSAAIAATLDLPINPNLGFAYIVPYKEQAQFQMGWKGFVQLAMRTGQYRTINASKVFEGDIKSHNRFTGEMVFAEDNKSTKLTGYIAFLRLINGFEKYHYMTVKEVEEHGKKYSKSYSNDKGQWKQNFDAMALKTVLKLLLNKYGILSIDMQTAIQSDQSVVGDDLEYVDRAEPMAIKTNEKTKALTDKLKVVDAEIVECTKDPKTCDKELGPDGAGKYGCELTKKDCLYSKEG